jgi:hypothetical protein
MRRRIVRDKGGQRAGVVFLYPPLSTGGGSLTATDLGPHS